MSLKEYRGKRHFDRTEEPEGQVKSSESGRLYVIQKHAASRLHYDFRLELDGVLKSWAVPKGPALDSSEKHLAVEVEDHPVEYGGFEGIIPENEYGGGTVMLWDRGHWESQGDPRKGYEKGRLKFRLFGQKLKGLWILTRMSAGESERNKNWLLIKSNDEYARPESAILEAQPLSVASGRSMDEIARDRDRVWSVLSENGETPDSEPVANIDEAYEAKTPAEDLSSLPGSRRSPILEAVRPQLATLVAEIPAGDDWLHEIKYDGYRMLGFKQEGKVRLSTRNGQDWTHRFTSVAVALGEAASKEFITDGEIVVKKADGTTDFQGLQNVLKGIESGRLLYCLFDLLYLNGYDLTRVGLLDRKELLRKMLKDAPAESVLQFSDHIRGKGQEVYRHACRYALEGVVSKRFDAAYRQKRSRDWVKSKCLHRQEFVITGFSRPAGSRTGFGALLLGYHTSAGELVYAGRVGTGFNDQTLRQLTEELVSLERKAPALSDPPTGTEAKGVRWVEPQRVAEVEFSQWTEEGRLRHPVFKGIREDKPAGEVVREKPGRNPAATNATSRTPPSERGRKAAAGNSGVKIGGIRLSNPQRVLYPDQGITKAELAGYYEKVADWILPHIAGRPLTIVRCPRGRQKKCFYQKHLTEQLPDSVKGIPIEEKHEEQIYIMIEDLAGLIALVQLGTLELHPWGSRSDRLERPDIMIFDLDPGPGISPADLVEGCRLLRKRLNAIGLKSFLKTSGGKGFHIVVPLVRRSGWDEVKAFSGAVAGSLAREHPQRFVAVMSKAKRKGKIFVDYLRNGRGATSVAPYSTRARPEAPVSAPVGWDELDAGLKPDTYTIENIPRRLQSLKQDPWNEFFDTRQSITVAMKKELKI